MMTKSFGAIALKCIHSEDDECEDGGSYYHLLEMPGSDSGCMLVIGLLPKELPSGQRLCVSQWRRLAVRLAVSCASDKDENERELDLATVIKVECYSLVLDDGAVDKQTEPWIMREVVEEGKLAECRLPERLRTRMTWRRYLCLHLLPVLQRLGLAQLDDSLSMYIRKLAPFQHGLHFFLTDSNPRCWHFGMLHRAWRRHCNNLYRLEKRGPEQSCKWVIAPFNVAIPDGSLVGVVIEDDDEQDRRAVMVLTDAGQICCLRQRRSVSGKEPTPAIVIPTQVHVHELLGRPTGTHPYQRMWLTGDLWAFLSSIPLKRDAHNAPSEKGICMISSEKDVHNNMNNVVCLLGDIQGLGQCIAVSIELRQGEEEGCMDDRMGELLTVARLVKATCPTVLLRLHLGSFTLRVSKEGVHALVCRIRDVFVDFFHVGQVGRQFGGYPGGPRWTSFGDDFADAHTPKLIEFEALILPPPGNQRDVADRPNAEGIVHWHRQCIDRFGHGAVLEYYGHGSHPQAKSMTDDHHSHFSQPLLHALLKLPSRRWFSGTGQVIRFPRGGGASNDREASSPPIRILVTGLHPPESEAQGHGLKRLVQLHKIFEPLLRRPQDQPDNPAAKENDDGKREE